MQPPIPQKDVVSRLIGNLQAALQDHARDRDVLNIVARYAAATPTTEQLASALIELNAGSAALAKDHVDDLAEAVGLVFSKWRLAIDVEQHERARRAR